MFSRQNLVILALITNFLMIDKNVLHFISFLGHKFDRKLMRHEYFWIFLNNRISDQCVM